MSSENPSQEKPSQLKPPQLKPPHEKIFNVITRPGLNILAPSACRCCCHLTARRTCSIWAFPETKWQSGQECPQLSEQPPPEIYNSQTTLPRDILT